MLALFPLSNRSCRLEITERLYNVLCRIAQVYLYDNGSSDKSRDLLRRFERSKFVQVRDWPYDGAQTEALNDCLCRFRHTARYVGPPQVVSSKVSPTAV